MLGCAAEWRHIGVHDAVDTTRASQRGRPVRGELFNLCHCSTCFGTVYSNTWKPLCDDEQF